MPSLEPQRVAGCKPTADATLLAKASQNIGAKKERAGRTTARQTGGLRFERPDTCRNALSSRRDDAMRVPGDLSLQSTCQRVHIGPLGAYAGISRLGTVRAFDVASLDPSAAHAHRA